MGAELTEPVPEDEAAEQQRTVQRLLGRCLLRLQQYEKLMKDILALHDICRPATEFAALKARKANVLATETLGKLVNKLFESYIVADHPGYAFSNNAMGDDIDLGVGSIGLRFRTTLQISAEGYADTKKALKDLVTLRNDLVHHLIDQFDVWTVKGCDAASAHLVHCYCRIDGHFQQLQGWAESVSRGLLHTASVMQSKAFEDLVVNGIAPDGNVAWSYAGIVSGLREAEHSLASKGWTQLDRAIAFLADKHPEQTPEKYKCRSWPQVLNDAKVFELQYKMEDDGRRVAWYRERPKMS